MNDKKFTNRPADHVNIEKGKELMWKHIRSKTLDKRGESLWDKLRDALSVHKRIAWGSVAASMLVVAIVFGNFSGWFTKGLIESPIVHAHFEMTADQEAADGVEPGSSFTLSSSEDYSEKLIAKGLVVEPEVE